MRLIMDSIRPELSELFPLEFAEIAEYDFVYTIASTNVVPNMVTIYNDEILNEFDYGSNLTVTSLSYLPLNKEKLFNLTLFTL